MSTIDNSIELYALFDVTRSMNTYKDHVLLLYETFMDVFKTRLKGAEIIEHFRICFKEDKATMGDLKSLKEVKKKYNDEKRASKKSDIIDSLLSLLEGMGTNRRRILIVFTDGKDNASSSGAKLANQDLLNKLKGNIASIVFSYGDAYFGDHFHYFPGNVFDVTSPQLLRELVEKMLIHNVDIKTKLAERGIRFNEVVAIKMPNIANNVTNITSSSTNIAANNNITATNPNIQTNSLYNNMTSDELITILPSIPLDDMGPPSCIKNPRKNRKSSKI